MSSVLLLAQGATEAPTSDDATPDNAVEQILGSINEMLSDVLQGLPNFGLALLIVLVAWLVGRVVRKRLEPHLASMRTKSFGRVFSSLAFAAIVAVGVVIALPIAFEGLNVGAMIASLGLLGVAAGFAFQDILSNLLAGILLLLRQPFTAGDQIEVDGIKGTVVLITIRETQIKTFDGRLTYVPNADVYSNAIEVQTADDIVRTSLLVGVGYDDDLGLARRTALDTLAAIDGIHDDPAPQAYYTEFAASSITLDLRYWTGSQQAEIRRVQDQVVERIKSAFDEAGIDIPFDIVMLDTSESFEQALVDAATQGKANGRGTSGGDGSGERTSVRRRS